MNGSLPLNSPFFEGQPHQAISRPWAGVLSDMLSASSASGSTTVAGTATYSLERTGTLAIASDVAPKTYVLSDFTPSLLRADVKGAPVGANLVVELSYYQMPGATTLVATFTIGPGLLFNAQSTTVAVPAGAWWQVDITGVGTTFGGSDLTVTVQ